MTFSLHKISTVSAAWAEVELAWHVEERANDSGGVRASL